MCSFNIKFVIKIVLIMPVDPLFKVVKYPIFVFWNMKVLVLENLKDLVDDPNKIEVTACLSVMPFNGVG